MTPQIMLATLCLNEIEWLEKLWSQHRDFPGLRGWAFIEAADVAYVGAAPEMVSSDGLSVDGTTEWLEKLHRREYSRVMHRKIGYVGDGGAQGKCAARNAYLEIADEIRPDWIMVIDGDEMYSFEDQELIADYLSRAEKRALLLRQRHLWRPPGVEGPLLAHEVVGGYASVPHVRIFPWVPGMRYTTNHNWPVAPDGALLTVGMVRLDEDPEAPECVHLGFASSGVTRRAKADYYQARGEGAQDGRQHYVDFREAWFAWKPGDELPHGARVIPYDGPRPEVLR